MLCEMGQNGFPTFMVSGLLSLWFLKSDEKRQQQLILSVPLPTFKKIFFSFAFNFSLLVKLNSTSSSNSLVGGFLGKEIWVVNFELIEVIHCQGYLWGTWDSFRVSSSFKLFHYSIKMLGLPWWRSGWESACQRREHGFEPWSGKIPHAAEQLSPWATTTEPARLEPVLRNKRGHDSERPTHRDEEWPPLAATRESSHTETKTQHSHK